MNNNPNQSETASQVKAILEYMNQGNRITPLVAYEEFGSLRLGARIKDIEKIVGYAPKREDIVVKNRHGKYVRVRSYWL